MGLLTSGSHILSFTFNHVNFIVLTSGSRSMTLVVSEWRGQETYTEYPCLITAVFTKA
jgi:hypothetical protein